MKKALVIVAVVVNLLRQEDVLYAVQRLQLLATGLVVHDTDGVVVDEVKTVDASAHSHHSLRGTESR